MPAGLDVGLRRFHPHRPPVMLLGGVNLLRALGLAGIPAIVASPEADADAAASRYCAGRCVLPPLQDRQAVLETLVRAGERLASALGCTVPLFYGDDTYLGLVQENRGRLASYYRFALNAPEIARALIDKACFQAFAESRGLPVPRTLEWNAVGRFEGPVLVKPRAKMYGARSAQQLRLFGAAKARVYPDGRSLAADPLAAGLRHELAVQEYVAGGDRQLWSFHGFAGRDGELLAWFIGRKLRTYPILTGESSYIELARNGELAALGRDIAARVPLKGVFKMDFKQDPACGEFRLLEINARYNLWHYLGAANGLNLAEVAYDYLVSGARPASTRYGTAVRWLAPRLDYKAHRELKLFTFTWLASLACSRKVYDLFSWSDPVPFLRKLAGRLGSRLQRLWLSPAS